MCDTTRDPWKLQTNYITCCTKIVKEEEERRRKKKNFFANVFVGPRALFSIFPFNFHRPPSSEMMIGFDQV